MAAGLRTERNSLPYLESGVSFQLAIACNLSGRITPLACLLLLVTVGTAEERTASSTQVNTANHRVVVAESDSLTISFLASDASNCRFRVEKRIVDQQATSVDSEGIETTDNPNSVDEHSQWTSGERMHYPYSDENKLCHEYMITGYKNGIEMDCKPHPRCFNERVRMPFDRSEFRCIISNDRGSTTTGTISVRVIPTSIYRLDESHKFDQTWTVAVNDKAPRRTTYEPNQTIIEKGGTAVITGWFLAEKDGLYEFQSVHRGSLSLKIANRDVLQIQPETPGNLSFGAVGLYSYQDGVPTPHHFFLELSSPAGRPLKMPKIEFRKQPRQRVFPYQPDTKQKATMEAAGLWNFDRRSDVLPIELVACPDPPWHELSENNVVSIDGDLKPHPYAQGPLPSYLTDQR